MKKIHKKLSYLLLTALLLCLMVGTSAAASLNYDRTCTFYLEGTGKYAKGTGIIGAFEDGSGNYIEIALLDQTVPFIINGTFLDGSPRSTNMAGIDGDT